MIASIWIQNIIKSSPLKNIIKEDIEFLWLKIVGVLLIGWCTQIY